MAFLKLFEDFVSQKFENNSKRYKSNNLDFEDNVRADLEQQKAVLTANRIITSAKTSNQTMEHSYMRDHIRPNCETTTGLPAVRTVLVRTRPQCPSCYTHPLEEHELDDGNQVPMPQYNEISAKEAMNECENLCKLVKNNNPDDLDWTNFVIRDGWSAAQRQLFDKVVRILDGDRLARLANAGRVTEPMYRRTMLDKAASRLRKVFANISWDVRQTSWLHSLLMDKLPQHYMASYIDIMQSLNAKVPSLVDKMVFSRPLNSNQEQLAPILKPKWNPTVISNIRPLEQNTYVIWLSQPYGIELPARLKTWMQQLRLMAKIVQIQLPQNIAHNANLPLEQLGSIIVAMVRCKVLELRNESLANNIILIGFNDGAAFALQAAMSEQVAAVICVSFAFNTLCGARGMPDDRILDIKSPVLFIFGQNAARTSREEIEGLREKMQSKTEAVCIGSADDFLRVSKTRRKLEGITQAVIDQAVLNEIYNFVKKTLDKPPGTRMPTSITASFNYRVPLKPTDVTAQTSQPSSQTKPYVQISRKRKADAQSDDTTANKSKVINIGRPRKTQLSANSNFNSKILANAKQAALPSVVASSSNELVMPDELINTILNDSNETDDTSMVSDILSTSPEKSVTNFELVSQSSPNKSLAGSTSAGTKIKMIPPNTFVQLKPQQLQSESKIYTIKTGMANVQPNRSNVSIGSIVNTTYNGTQFNITNTANAPKQYVIKTNSNVSLAQPKYAVIKNANGTTSLQMIPQNTMLSRAAAATTTAATSALAATPNLSSSSSSMDISSIIDLPILMDDGDGNLSNLPITNSETAIASSSLKPSGATGQLIISQKIIRDAANSSAISSNPQKGGTFIVNPSATAPQKMMIYNPKTMKPISIGSQSITQITKLQAVNSPVSTGTPATTVTTNIKSLNLQALRASLANSSGGLNISGGSVAANAGASNVINLAKQFPQLKIINATPAISSSSGGTAQINAVRSPLVVTSGGLKQLSPSLKTHFLNRNVTLKKYTVTPASATATATAAGTLNITTPTAAMQSVPKIITLNPNFNTETSAANKQHQD